MKEDKSYGRCSFINQVNQQQCDKWHIYSKEDNPDMLCEIHLGKIESPKTQISKIATIGGNSEYKDFINERLPIVQSMSLEETEIHIAKLSKLLEQVKSELLMTNAQKRTILDGYNEDQRKEYITRVRKQESPTVIKKVVSKVPNMKDDPIGYLMYKNPGMTKAEAEDLWND